MLEAMTGGLKVLGLFLFTSVIREHLAVYTFRQQQPLPLRAVDIDLQQVLSVTEDEYLSICLDPYLKHDFPGKPWSTLRFNNPRVHTLARGLAPAILRFGGTDADWSVFYNVTSASEQAEVWRTTANLLPKPAFIVPFFPQDIDNLHSLAKSAGGRLLYDLNIQLRFGSQWNPNNAFLLMRYIQEQGYAKDMDFELGNEPNYPQLSISGERIGQDVMILKHMLLGLRGYENVRIVGPDIGIATGGYLLQIAQDFAKTVQKNITAQTCHHYYFKGPGASVNEFLDVKHFDSFEHTIITWRDALRNASGVKQDVWVGETSDAYDYGAPNITNRYISGLLWLDKLGLAAKNEYKLVARQDFFGGNYPLLSNAMYPNPDYWLSHVFKQLVGRKVLKVDVAGMTASGNLVRGYAHCTSPRATLYTPGSITVYIVNLIPNNHTMLKFDPQRFGKAADFYQMSPVNGNLLSQTVALNGKVLNMVDDNTLPRLNPVEFSLAGNVKIERQSYAFVVLKDANAAICKM